MLFDYFFLPLVMCARSYVQQYTINFLLLFDNTTGMTHLNIQNRSFTHISFFDLRTRSLIFIHLVRKIYKVKGTEFWKLSMFTFLRSHVILSLLCPNIFHSYLLSNTFNQNHCHHTVSEAVSFAFGETSLPSTYGVESSDTNVPNYSVRFQQILHCHCR